MIRAPIANNAAYSMSSDSNILNFSIDSQDIV